MIKLPITNWKSYSFKDIANNISERIEPANTDLQKYVGLEHIEGETIRLKRIGKRDDVKGAKLRCYPGDVIFGRRRAYLRKAAIVDFDGFCSAHCLVLRANSEVINPRLFPFFLHSNIFMERAIKISVGSLSPTINWGTLKEQQFYLPLRGLQDQLADLLWSSEGVVDSARELVDKNNIFSKVKLKALLFGHETYKKDDLTHVPRIGYLPKDWKVVKLSSLFDRVTDRNKRLETNNILTISAQHGLVNQDRYFTRNVASKDISGYYLLTKGDFVYNKSYSDGFPAGVIKVLDKFEKGVVSPLYICFRSKENEQYTSFYKHLFSTGLLNDQILSIAKEGARNHGLLNVGTSDFFDLKVPYPCKKFVPKVLKEVDSLFLNTRVIDEYYESSKLLNKSLINRIFTHDV